MKQKRKQRGFYALGGMACALLCGCTRPESHPSIHEMEMNTTAESTEAMTESEATAPVETEGLETTMEVTSTGFLETIALGTKESSADITTERGSMATSPMVEATMAEATTISQAMAETMTVETTIAPTTIAPTTIAPTMIPPTMGAPTLVPPTVIATTVAPTTIMPTTIAPTSIVPTTIAPTTPAPTTAPPTSSVYETTTEVPPETTKEPIQAPDMAYVQALWEEINRARQAVGAPPLRWVEAYAEKESRALQSLWQAEQQGLTVGLDQGHTWTEAERRVRFQVSSGLWYEVPLAENLHLCSVRSSAIAVVRAVADSPGHYRTMVNPIYDEGAVAFLPRPDGWMYVGMVFWDTETPSLYE